jgi:glutaredoxin
MSFLPEADAIILVTSVEAPLNAAEAAFLGEIRQYGRKLFAVVNKMDLLAPAERDEVLAYIATGMGRALSLSEVRLYPVSARQALAAKLSGDAAGLCQSGLPELEQVLASFLGAEKGGTFLVSVLDRALRLLLAADEPTLAALVASMSDLRARLMAGDLAGEAEQLQEQLGLPAIPPAEPAPASSMARHSPAHEALATSTCPICAYQSQALFDFFVQAQYDLVNSEAAKLRLAAERGFCQRHTWQFEQIASPQGISEGYARLIETTAQQLKRLAERDAEGAAVAVAALLQREAACPACQVLEQAEAAGLQQFLAEIANAEGQARYQRSAGLCLGHLRTALLRLREGPVASFLVEVQAQRLEEIAEDMRAYVLKREALRRDLLNSEEKGAWRRALVQLAGEPVARPSLPEESYGHP